MKKKGEEKTTVLSDNESLYQNNAMRGFSIYNSEGNVEYKAEVERMVYELRQELYPTQEVTAPVLTVKNATASKKASRVKDKNKKKAPVVFVLIFNVLILAVIALGCFDLGKAGTMIAPFYKETATAVVPFSVLDGLFSLTGMGAVVDYYIYDAFAQVMLIVFAAAGALLTALTVWQIIAAIVSLARKKEKREIRFGVRAFFMLLCFVAILLSIVALKAEFGFGDICSLILPPSLGEFGLPRVDEGYVLYSGYGAYALIILPILTMICSACIYKRKK